MVNQFVKPYIDETSVTRLLDIEGELADPRELRRHVMHFDINIQE
jgi:hypothetical protein